MESLARYEDHATLLLRIGLGALFAYFGINAIIDPANQAQWMARWVPEIFKTDWILMTFGTIQTLLAIALILGIAIRYAAILAAMLLIGITINLGLNEIAYRDATLAIAALVLATRPKYRWTCTTKKKG